MWMEAYTTSSDPKVVASYYVEAVKKHGGCPKIMRADMGTENGHVAVIQRFLRSNGVDNLAQNSFLYGKSTANQRIEFWWSILRKENSEFWIKLFHAIKNDGYFCGYQLEKEIVQFCFLNLIQVGLMKMLIVSQYYSMPNIC